MTTIALKPSPVLVVRRAVSLAAARLLAALERQRRRRALRATHAALDGLDARTLRDLGLDRSELGSVAAEAHGHALPHRVRVLHGLFVPR